MAKKPVRPRDVNQLAKLITEIASGDKENLKSVLAHPGRRKGGLKGGVSRANKLTPKERSEIAAKAAKKRWEKS